MNYPCEHCGEQAACDGRICAGWAKWFRASWDEAVERLRELVGMEG